MLLPYPAIYTGLYLLKNVWVAMISYHLLLLLVNIAYFKNYTVKNMLHGFNLQKATIFIIPAALNGLVIYLLWPFIKLEHINLAEKLTELGIYGKLWCLFIPYYVIITPWLEEYFWRGILGSDKKLPDVSDILYAGYHILVLLLFIKLFWSILTFIILVFTAWMWRSTKIKYKGLYIPLLSHIVADASTVVAIFALTLKV